MDNSVEIAKSLGCDVISWSGESKTNVDYLKFLEIKDNCWKHIKSGWIILPDMDEYICVTEDDLINEKKQGTTMLQTRGLQMIGESDTLDLSDIDLQEIKKYIDDNIYSKKICFLREFIQEIKYTAGCHSCSPIGTIKDSSKIYLLKHMNNLGLKFLLNKNIKAYERTSLMRSKNMATHYTNDLEKIKSDYNKLLSEAKLLE
jgi:hypothetical protein